MKREISRREVVDRIRVDLRQLGFDDVSTRRGRLDQTFHIDGKGIIGRGTVSDEKVGVAVLQRIYDEVYTLDRMKAKRSVFLTYGTYSREAIRFARTHKIALYTFDERGEVTLLQAIKPERQFTYFAPLARVSATLLVVAAVIVLLIKTVVVGIISIALIGIVMCIYIDSMGSVSGKKSKRR